MTGSKTRILVDADVLYSRTLRDWLLLMSDSVDERSSYAVHWTEDILAETVARMRDDRPDIASGQLEAIGDRLRELCAAGRIAGFEAARSTFIGQDEGDLHVHSAAVAGQVDVVVTNDQRGLLPSAEARDLLDDLPYEVMTPDDFLVTLFEQTPVLIRDCTRRQLKYFMTRKTREINLSESLRRAGAPCFAECVRRTLQTIDFKSLDC